MTTASPAKGAIPHIDPIPYPGQPDAEVTAWLARKAAPNDPSGYTLRQYSRELHNNKSDPAPRYGSDSYVRSYGAWLDRLTESQRVIVKKAREHRENDPKHQARLRDEDKARLEKQGADPAYRQGLAEKRANYAAKIEAEEGREVRRYRHNRTADEIRLDRKQRNDKMRAHIRDELASKRNPFAVEVAHKSVDAERRHTSKYLICGLLLRDGQLDPALESTLTIFADAMGVSIDDARDLMAGAVEALRVAKAIRKERGIIRLHRDIERAAEREQDEADRQAIALHTLF